MNIEELAKPLNPDAVKVGDSGPLRGVKYLTGQYAIETANRIFGFGGWGFELIGQPWIVEEGRQGRTTQEDGTVGTPYEVWAAAGRLTVKDCQPFADVGTCVRQGKGSGGLEMAIKGAVTDCLKRCLRNYGDQFGLVLYEKGLTMRDLEEEYRGEAPQQGGRPAERTAPPPAAAPKSPRESRSGGRCTGRPSGRKASATWSSPR